MEATDNVANEQGSLLEENTYRNVVLPSDSNDKSFPGDTECQ
jgi:hypothetical protein